MYAITKMPPEIVCLLIDGFPDALRQENNTGLMPLDLLCRKKYLDDAAALEILKLLVEKCPESVRHADSDGDHPLHLACSWGEKSPEFCRILIEAYPRSAQSANDRGALPFHWACFLGTVATAEYLYKLYPDSINMEDENGTQIQLCN
jgi:ankyrin repeat protein